MAAVNQQRIFRLAFCVTLSSATIMILDWPLAFIAPLLLVSIVSGSDTPPTLKSSLGMIIVIAAGMFCGHLFSALFLPQPILACILLAIGFFWIYYLNNLGKLPNFVSLMLLLGLTLIPMMTLIDPVVATLISSGLTIGAVVALLFAGLGFLLFPAGVAAINTSTANKAITNKKEKKEEKEKKKQKLNPETENAGRRALVSTLAVLPILILFIVYEWSGATLIIAFIAILSLNPELDNVRKAGLGLMLGNCLGGAIAIVFFHWVKISPHLSVYTATMALASLWISRQVYSGRKLAPLWGTALSTLLLLTGSVMSGSGGEADAKFITRIVQIILVGVYMIIALGVINYLAGVVIKLANKHLSLARQTNKLL